MPMILHFTGADWDEFVLLGFGVLVALVLTWALACKSR